MILTQYFVFENRKLTIKHKEIESNYKLISNSIFNIYNEVAVIAVLTEIGLTYEQIQSALEKEKIVESRYSEESINGIKIVNHLAKGQNPIACSCVFDYIRHEKGNKELVLLLYDKFDAKSSSESMPWLYDCDFEFLNDDSIQKIIIGGPRAEDFYLRLLIAGVPKEKLIFVDNAEKTSEYVSLAEDIYILYDVYDEDIAMNVKKNIKESFGNAMVPFLVENFQNVYVIDYRYYKDSVSELVDKNNIENVVFVNNISITSTSDRVQELKDICK